VAIANISLLRGEASSYLARTSTIRGQRRTENAMNVYTGLLFLQGHIIDPTLFADAEPGYGNASYGNRIATARALREPWERGDEVGDGAAGADDAKAA
jgi:hypothetical protein